MQTNTLFRHQVLEAQQQRINGQVLLRPRVSFVVITIALFVWLTAVVSWLVSGNYAYCQTQAYVELFPCGCGDYNQNF